MNYWIFQSRTFDPTLLRTGAQIPWRATRYRTEMHSGDLVFLWIAGTPDKRGVYGWGQLTSGPYGVSGSYRVGFLFQKRLGSFISEERIRSQPILSNLMILRVRVGTNFLISHQEAKAIASLMDAGERPQVA